MNQGKITKEICLTREQWKKVIDALYFYECAASEFLSPTDRDSFCKEYLMPICDQMPDEVL